MTTLELFRTLARYNRWMNERLYAICAELPDSTRKEDRGAAFRSIYGTLNHLLLTDRVWLGRFLQRPFAVESLDQELYADFDELRAERAATDAEIDNWAGSLTEEALGRPFRFVSISRPQERTMPLALVAMHFFNHQTHHRGQLTTLLWQSGVDTGVTDLLWLPDAESRA